MPLPPPCPLYSIPCQHSLFPEIPPPTFTSLCGVTQWEGQLHEHGSVGDTLISGWLLPCWLTHQWLVTPLPQKSLAANSSCIVHEPPWLDVDRLSLCQPSTGYFSSYDYNSHVQKIPFPSSSLHHQILHFCLLFYDILYTLEVKKMSHLGLTTLQVLILSTLGSHESLH